MKETRPSSHVSQSYIDPSLQESPPNALEQIHACVLSWQTDLSPRLKRKNDAIAWLKIPFPAEEDAVEEELDVIWEERDLAQKEK